MYVTLKRNDRLPTVALAQARLLEKNFDLVVDGWFGELTEKAVEKFQHEVGLPVTKWVDQATWMALNESHPMRK